MAAFSAVAATCFVSHTHNLCSQIRHHILIHDAYTLDIQGRPLTYTHIRTLVNNVNMSTESSLEGSCMFLRMRTGNQYRRYRLYFSRTYTAQRYVANMSQSFFSCPVEPTTITEYSPNME